MRGHLMCAQVALALLGGCAAPRRAPEFPPLQTGTLRFQQRLQGLVPSAVTTLRWELRLGAREAQLRVTRWRGGAAPAEESLRYEGSWTQDHRGLTLHAGTEQEVAGLPRELSLTCLRTLVAVLPAGAELLQGDACKGDGPLPSWRPAAATDVAAWHCQVAEEPAGPWTGFERTGPLTFAAGPGIEWLYVNNDCAGQEGAYRFPGAYAGGG